MFRFVLVFILFVPNKDIFYFIKVSKECMDISTFVMWNF